MKLSSKAIQSLQEIFLEKYGIDLTDQEANKRGINLIKFLIRIGYFKKHDRHDKTKNSD